jgi:hypothetical protein
MSVLDRMARLLSRRDARTVLTVTILDDRSERQAELINLFRDDLETHVRTLPIPGRMRFRSVRPAEPVCRSR